MQDVQLNNSPSIIQDKVKWAEVLGQCIVFLILPPIIGIPVVIYQIWRKKNATKTDYYKFFICIVLYFACINATKHPEGDQWQYYAAYMNVPDVGFIGSLIWIYGYDVHHQAASSISGEFMNGVYNYVGYYLTFGYYPLFVFIYTVVEYMLMFIGFYRFTRTMKEPHKPFVCGIIILSFFYLFFQYTFQIQKQFMAQAIMMFVLGSYAATGKMTKGLWITSACAVFTHASTWLFIPFLIYKPLWGRVNKLSLLLLAIAFSYAIFYGPRMAGNIANNDMGVAGYGLERMAESETNNDVDGFALVWSQIIVIALPMAWVVYKQLWIRKNKSVNTPHAYILKIVMLLLLTVVAMFRQPLAQYRYFMMLLAFMPYVYPFFSNNTIIRNRILSIIAIVMVGWFYYQFDKIVWHYAPEIDIIIKSPILLVISGNGV